MKHLLLVVFLLYIVNPADAQDNEGVASAIKKIINDTSAFFSTIKGETHNLPSSEPRYHSGVTIPGTFNNEITIHSTRRYSSFFATISENITEKEAKTLLEKWRQLLKQILGNEYRETEKTGDNEPGKPVKEYKFIRGKLEFVIFYYKAPRSVSKGKKTCQVQLYILYSPLKS
jgi:hypothetical protein